MNDCWRFGWRALQAVVLIGALSTVSCMAQDTAKRTVTVREESNGTTVTLVVGDVLAVALGAQMGTGYTWVPSNDTAPVLRSHGKPEQTAGAGTAGRVDLLTFRYTAMEKGTLDLDFGYRRPWTQEEPLKRFSIRVTVH
jgi:predicted secreted protein